MDDERLADEVAANPFALPRLHPGIREPVGAPTGPQGLLDHLISSQQEPLRNRQTELLRNAEVENELHPIHALDRQVPGVCACENTPDVLRRQATHLIVIHAVARAVSKLPRGHWTLSPAVRRPRRRGRHAGRVVWSARYWSAALAERVRGRGELVCILRTSKLRIGRVGRLNPSPAVSLH